MCDHYTTCAGKEAPRSGIYFPSRGSRYNPCGAGRSGASASDCTMCDHYTTCAGKEAPRSGIYFPSRGSRYNPCGAGRSGASASDCTMCNHYTTPSLIFQENRADSASILHLPGITPHLSPCTTIHPAYTPQTRTALGSVPSAPSALRKGFLPEQHPGLSHFSPAHPRSLHIPPYAIPHG